MNRAAALAVRERRSDLASEGVEQNQRRSSAPFGWLLQEWAPVKATPEWV